MYSESERTQPNERLTLQKDPGCNKIPMIANSVSALNMWFYPSADRSLLNRFPLVRLVVILEAAKVERVYSASGEIAHKRTRQSTAWPTDEHGKTKHLSDG
jgi:hypothetical protein